MNKQNTQAIRDFNRYYTRFMGLLDNHILNSPFSLPEARVLYELYHRQPCFAREIGQELGLDKGYLSRILQDFQRKGLLQKTKDKSDGRATKITLTEKGNLEFEKIDTASIQQIKKLLTDLQANDWKKLIAHMNEIKRIITNTKDEH